MLGISPICTMSFYHIYLLFSPSSFSMALSPTYLSPSFMSSFCITCWLQLLLSICAWVWGYSVDHGQPSRAHTPEEKWFSIPYTHQLSGALWIGEGIHDLSPTHARILAGLILCRSYAGEQNYHEFIVWQSRHIQETLFLIFLHYFCFLWSFCPVCHTVPWALVRWAREKDVLFRDELSLSGTLSALSSRDHVRVAVCSAVGF